MHIDYPFNVLEGRGFAVGLVYPQEIFIALDIIIHLDGRVPPEKSFGFARAINGVLFTGGKFACEEYIFRLRPNFENFRVSIRVYRLTVDGGCLGEGGGGSDPSRGVGRN